MVLQCLPVPAPLRGSGWEQPRRWLSFCSGTEIFCVWVVAGGGCWALALGFFSIFFSPLQNAFSLFNTRWFGISPGQNPHARLPLSLHVQGSRQSLVKGL